ncbi:unnamed protein product [Durusdinium trenchii]|uniref:SET domain-containing protein n=1 Tax=Durusdinium trenchii TaxID=1381693 RepID=A0ABP0N7V2_9DINO
MITKGVPLRANGLQSLQGTSVCDLISRANHSCRPNATLCPEESGIIRLVASTSLKPGDEVLISYLSGEDLLRPTWARQRELQRGPWGFTCACTRCAAPDDARGMRCARCGSGCHFPHPDGRWTNCTACGLAAGEGARSFEEVEDDWHQAAWLCLTASESFRNWTA